MASLALRRENENYPSLVSQWIKEPFLFRFHKLFSLGDSLFYGYPKGWKLEIARFVDGQLILPIISRDQLRGMTQPSRKTLRELQSILSSKQGALTRESFQP